MLPAIFKNQYLYDVSYQLVCEIKMQPGHLRLSKSKDRDGFKCVYVCDISGYYPVEHILLRFDEQKNVLWGRFDITQERVEKEIDGDMYTRQQDKPTEWFPLELPESFLYEVLVPAMEVVLS